MANVYSPPASLCRWWRLYAAGLIATLPLLGVFILQQHMPGFLLGPGDFTAFYTGALLVRQAPTELYDMARQTDLQRTILAPFGWTYADGVLLYNYPPSLAIITQWLAFFPLAKAYWLWLFTNIGCVLLIARFSEIEAKGMFVWFLFMWPITWMVLLQGQPVALSACLLVAGWWSWRHGSRTVAGFLWAWLLIKPQLGTFVWLWILWRRDRAAIRGLFLGGGTLLLLTSLITGWRSLLGWWDMLRFTAEATGSYGIPPTRMPNFFGVFSALGIPEHWAWPAWGIGAFIILMLLVRLWLHTSSDTLAFAAAIVATLLFTPHSFLHDLFLLVVIAPLIWRMVETTPHARTAMLILLGTHAAAFVNIFSLAPLLVAGLWVGILLVWWWLLTTLAHRPAPIQE